MAAKGKLTIGQALLRFTGRLSDAGIAGARVEAERLLCHVLSCKRHELFINSDNPLPTEAFSRFLDYIRRRELREPLQYITGEEEFRGLAFKVTRDTLIPRPETELLIEEAVSLVPSFADPRGMIFVDLCTGGGCIAVSLAKEAPSAVIYATDASASALAVARDNARRHGVSDRITFAEGDLFAALEPFGIRGGASFIVSNPPYVSISDYENLQPEIRDYEPAAALLAGKDGLEFYRRIIPQALDYLKDGGYLLLEIGFGQARGLIGLLRERSGYGDIEAISDLNGIERVVRARKKAKPR